MAGSLPGVTDFSGLRIGDPASTVGSAMTWVAYTSSSLSTMIVLGNQTSTQTFAFSNVTPGDLLTVTMLSALSNSVGIANAFVSAAGVVSIAFSNASSTSQTIGVNTVYMQAARLSNATRF